MRNGSLSYRDQALKLFPWVCARCAREFDGKRLRELTLHHKDHNHDNNPADGSNWELLCIYCHEQEHNKTEIIHSGPDFSERQSHDSTYRPFAELKKLIDRKTRQKD